MKQNLIHRMKRATLLSALVALLLPAASCESIYDGEEVCPEPIREYYIRFIYDMNLLYADAFNSQVKSVDLYVFDAQTNAFVAHYAEQGAPLTQEGYLMKLDLEPGTYNFLAWGGLANNNGDFMLGTSNVLRVEDLSCVMARSTDAAGAYSDRDLHALFHGTVSATLPDEEGIHIATLPMMKDTNGVILTLSHLDDTFDADRFVVTMTDANGGMAGDNSLNDDEVIEYRPWNVRTGTVDTGSLQGEMGFLSVEFTTARLMADHESRITIFDTQKGEPVFSIPLVKYALELRSAHYADMDDQEYLDREDSYDIMVFLQDPENWAGVTIVINGWHVIDNGQVTL